MKTPRFLTGLLCALMGTGLFVTALVAAQTPLPDVPDEERLAEISEETGSIASLSKISPDCTFDKTYGLYLCPYPLPAVLPQANPEEHARALAGLNTKGLLLVPDITSRRVMAFDPETGDVVDPNFVPADPMNMNFPINAILSPNGNSILVSDLNADVILEYDFNGSFVGVFAPIGGANDTIMDGPRGMTLTSGNLLVTTSNDNVVQFDSDGNYLGVFISTDTSTGNDIPDSPFDIIDRTDDWLISAANSDAIHIFSSMDRSYQGDLTPVNGLPTQLTEDSNGNVLVANVTGDVGVLEFTSDGTLTNTYIISDTLAARGVYILPNGNILASAGTANAGNLYEIDRTTAAMVGDPKLPPGSYTPRYIEFVTIPRAVYLPLIVR